jgi:uncharacterized protein (TIGR02246 family)
MRAFPVAAVIAAALVLLPWQASAQATSTNRATPEQAKAIRALYERLLIADAKRDTSELNRILAPDYTFVPARGDTILTRQERLNLTVAPDTSRGEVKYTLHDCRSQVHGAAAVAHCRYRATVRYPKATADTVREFISTAVFVRQGNKWRIVATHPSLVRSRERSATTTSDQGAPAQNPAAAADTAPVKVVERAEEAFWNRDVDALMTFYAPNTEGFVLALGDSAAKGPRDFTKTRATYTKAFENPGPRGKVLHTIEHGPYVVRQYETGSADHPKALWMFEVRGGKIRRYWTTRVSAP